MAGSCAAASAADAFDDDELAIPSDLEAALTLLLERAPACAHQLKVATVCQLYAILNDKTDVDRELEEMLCRGKLRIIELPMRQEQMLVLTSECQRALRAARRAATPGGEEDGALELCSHLLRSCRSTRLELAHLLEELRVIEHDGCAPTSSALRARTSDAAAREASGVFLPRTYFPHMSHPILPIYHRLYSSKPRDERSALQSMRRSWFGWDGWCRYAL